MNFLIAYWWVAVALDWSSTIEAHDYRVEENPFMRDVWANHGDAGFTVMSLLIGAIVSIAIWAGYKVNLKWILYIGLFPVVTFKILIALTNLAVIPLWVTGWWQY